MHFTLTLHPKTYPTSMASQLHMRVEIEVRAEMTLYTLFSSCFEQDIAQMAATLLLNADLIGAQLRDTLRLHLISYLIQTFLKKLLVCSLM